jgi:hypothetical protein
VIYPAFLFFCIPFNNPIYIGDIEGYVTAPLAVFPERIYGFYPFGKGATFFPDKGVVLPFCFEDKDLFIVQSDEKIGIVIMGHSFKGIEYAKAQMVVFGPRGNMGVFLNFISFGGLPSAVVDAMADMGFYSWFSVFGCPPGRHISCGTYFAVVVKDRDYLFGFPQPDEVPQMFYNTAHVEHKHYAYPQFIHSEKGWIYAYTVRFKIAFYPFEDLPD